jgi:hypothetical protein
MASNAYSTALQQQSYGPFADAPNPYPLAALAGNSQAAMDRDIQPGNGHAHPHIAQASNQELLNGAPTGTSEGKARLRKACDACSIRKVKVNPTLPIKHWALADLDLSAMNKALHVELALRSPFHVPSNAPVEGEDPRTDMPKLSRGGNWDLMGLVSQSQHRPLMQHTPLPLSRNSKFFLPNQYVHSPSYTSSWTTTSPISIL